MYICMYMQVGEHITVTGRVDEDWLEGSLQGRKGIFPASVIDRVPPGLSQVGEETKNLLQCSRVVWTASQPRWV